MDKEKLNKWAEQLLEMQKRNNLINFKDTKSTTVEVVIPDPHLLFERVNKDICFEVFETKAKDNSRLNSENDDNLPELQKEEYIQKYSIKLHRQNQLLLYNNSGCSDTAINVISKRAKECIEETGINIAYMAFGFVHWKEKENSEYEFSAPMLLIPITFIHETVLSPFQIKPESNDIIVNPILSYKLSAEYGATLPEYSNDSLNTYIEKVNDILKNLNWHTTEECKISLFSFQKINMYQDLTDNTEKILNNPNIQLLLGEHDTDIANTCNYQYQSQIKNPIIELHNVVDADSSQIEAINVAKSGSSFVLQGPPELERVKQLQTLLQNVCMTGKKYCSFLKKWRHLM